MSSLPIIDLEPFLSGENKSKPAKDIYEACTDTGFFYIKNHGISAEQLQTVFDLMERYFSQSEEEKLQVDARDSSAFRGYFPIKGETLDPDIPADLKEGFDMGRHVPVDHIGVKEGWYLHAPNRFPKLPEDFDPVMNEHYRVMTRLGQKLMQVFALSLDLEETYFDQMVNDPFAILRLLHYPPQGKRKHTDAMGAGAHTDYGCFTILANDKNGGLEIQHKKGEWLQVEPIPGCFVINISDMMQRWTNDLYKSTVHRVINITGNERYSIPFFFDPNHDAVVECLPGCCSEKNPARYPPIKAGEYLYNRLAAAF